MGVAELCDGRNQNPSFSGQSVALNRYCVVTYKVDTVNHCLKLILCSVV